MSAVVAVVGAVLAVAALRQAGVGVAGSADWRGLVARLHARLTRRRRHAAAVAGLPEVLRRLAAELAAGRTLERALASAGRSGPAELGEALRAAGEGLARGVPLERALTSALPRDPACRLLAAALALHRRSGGDLPALCRDLARTLDERQRVEAEMAALTAQARLSARVVPLLPPASLLALSALDPAALRLLLGTPAGLLLLGMAGALNLGGALAVRRLVRGIG